MKANRKVTISKYKHTRFWALWLGTELLAVVCYKKGALALCQHLEKTSQQSPADKT